MTCFSSSLLILLLKHTHFLPSVPKNLFAHILSLCHLASFQPPIHFEMASPIFALHSLLSPCSHTLPSSTGSHHPQRPCEVILCLQHAEEVGYYTKYFKYFLKKIEVQHVTTAAKCTLLNFPNSWPFPSDDLSKVFSLCMFSELSLELSIHCLHLSPAGSAVLCIVGQRCQSKNCIRQKHKLCISNVSVFARVAAERTFFCFWQTAVDVETTATIDSISYAVI